MARRIRRVRRVRRGHTRVSRVAMDPARRVGDLIRRDDRLAPLEAYSPQKSTLVSPVNKGALLGPFGPFWANRRLYEEQCFFFGFLFARRDVPGLFLDFFFTFSIFSGFFFYFFPKEPYSFRARSQKKKKGREKKIKKKKRKKRIGREKEKEEEEGKKRSWLNADRWIWER